MKLIFIFLNIKYILLASIIALFQVKEPCSLPLKMTLEHSSVVYAKVILAHLNGSYIFVKLFFIFVFQK